MVKIIGLSGGNDVIEAGDSTIFYHPTDKSLENWNPFVDRIDSILDFKYEGSE